MENWETPLLMLVHTKPAGPWAACRGKKDIVLWIKGRKVEETWISRFAETQCLKPEGSTVAGQLCVY